MPRLFFMCFGFAPEPQDPRPMNFADFHRKGAAGLPVAFPQRSEPGPGGAHGSDCGSTSILVFRTVILPPGFSVMTRFTEWLPIAPIPEQFLIATVGNNVIHNRCFGIASLLHALHTQRVGLKERFACLLPAAAVAALCGRPCYLRVERLVFLTKLCSWFHKRWTSGMSTGNSWLLWNGYHHLRSHKKAPAILQTDASLYSSIFIDLWTILF